MAIKDLELPGQGRMENLESWHGDLERSVRGSPDVGIRRASLPGDSKFLTRISKIKPKTTEIRLKLEIKGPKSLFILGGGY